MRIIRAVLLGLCMSWSILAWSDPRKEIDEKRQGIWFLSKKALEVSAEMLRLDTTYYVGWLYEGSGKYERAQDGLGYRNAIKPLEKSLKKMEREFTPQIKMRSKDLMAYIGAYQVQQDYCMNVYLLYQCYMNIERQDLAFECLKKYKKKNLQKTFFIEPANSMSWIIHRCRTFNSSHYPFLKNSIEDNENLALRYIDSSMYKIRLFYNLNTSIFPQEYVTEDFYFNYHNKALIYTYVGELDSAEHYYDLYKDTRYFSDNNYAYLKLITGDFKNCEKHFLIEKAHENPREKQTREFSYMLGIINTYKGNPQQDIVELAEKVKRMGIIPGYGWNNIALARAYYYGGYYTESDRMREKAEKFQELHINTTWAPEQYDYAVNLYRYLNKNRRIKAVKFQDEHWYFKSSNWVKVPKLFLQAVTDRFYLTGKFGSNPEREIAFYKLFNSESVMSFDEVWLTIDGFNTSFFINKFKQYLREDKRENIHRYYKLMLGHLYANDGDYEQAEKYYMEVLNDKKLDPEYEKLAIARCYEGLIKIYTTQNKKDLANDYYLRLFQIYPTLIPYSGIQSRFKVKPVSEPTLKEVVEELKSTSLELIPSDEPMECPEVTLSLMTDSAVKYVNYLVSLRGETLHEGSVKIEKKEGAGKILAYHLFNIPTTEIEAEEKNNYWLILWLVLPALVLWIAWSIKKSAH